jgi:hypothetical protein
MWRQNVRHGEVPVLGQLRLQRRLRRIAHKKVDEARERTGQYQKRCIPLLGLRSTYSGCLPCGLFHNPNRAPCPVGHYDRPKAARGKSRVHKTCDQDRLYPVVKQHIPIICETRLTSGGSYDGLPLRLARCRWPCPS